MKQKKFIHDYSLPIGIGFILILITGLKMSLSSLWALARIWPFLLLVVSLGLLLHSHWRNASRLLNTLALCGAMAAIIFAPQLGWGTPTAIFSFHLTDHDEIFMGPGTPGSGNILVETRQVDGFKGLNVEYPAQVFIVQGSVEALKIEAEDNLLPDIKTEVHDATLEIFYKRTGASQISPTKPVIMTLIVKDLNEVNFSRAGELIINGLKTDNLYISLKGDGNLKATEIFAQNFGVRMSGAGNATVVGQVNDLYVSVDGTGNFDGTSLHGKTACVYIRNAGNATLWIDEQLDVKISGAGNIQYYGKPQVTKLINYGRYVAGVKSSRCN